MHISEFCIERHFSISYVYNACAAHTLLQFNALVIAISAGCCTLKNRKTSIIIYTVEGNSHMLQWKRLLTTQRNFVVQTRDVTWPRKQWQPKASLGKQQKLFLRQYSFLETRTLSSDVISEFSRKRGISEKHSFPEVARQKDRGRYRLGKERKTNAAKSSWRV